MYNLELRNAYAALQLPEYIKQRSGAVHRISWPHYFAIEVIPPQRVERNQTTQTDSGLSQNGGIHQLVGFLVDSLFKQPSKGTLQKKDTPRETVKIMTQSGLWPIDLWWEGLPIQSDDLEPTIRNLRRKAVLRFYETGCGSFLEYASFLK